MRTICSAILAVVVISSPAFAQDRLVVGGQTSVLLDLDLLSSGAGLELSGVSGDVIAPGNLGADSVAFGINARDGSLPTTFAYTAGTLAPFSGTIEHLGSVFFNTDTIEVGNFSIGFDDTRVGDNRSGFFVGSTVGINEILFDVANPNATPDLTQLSIEGDLLVSSEFAGILGDAGLTGVDVGNALVEANAVPEPTGVAMVGLLGMVVCFRRRRKTV